MHRFLVMATLSVFLAPNTFDRVFADDTDAEKQQIAAALKLTTDAAKNYQLTVGETAAKPCELSPKPILKWSNPVAGNIYGNVFLWTHEKQPVAVGSFYKWFSPWTHSTHEFHSLTNQPLFAQFNDAPVWHPKAGGVEWMPLDDVAKPSDAAPARLLQMRRVSRQFSVEKTDKEGERRRMRLLSQPVYRYASPGKNVIDGALFVFVQGTDPEVWLLMEAFDSTPAKPVDDSSARIKKWRYAVARMNGTHFAVRRNEKIVREFPVLEWKRDGDRSASYFKINTDDLPPATK